MAAPTFIVTRPEPEAGVQARALAARGHAVLVNPVLVYRPIPVDPTILADVDCLCLTSQRTTDALWDLFRSGALRPGLPVFGVGEATVEAARAVGAQDARAAGGDAEALAALLVGAAPGRRIGYLHGVDTARDLAALVAAAAQRAGVQPPDLIPVCVYAMDPVDRLSDELIAVLAQTETPPLWAVLMSPRTAGQFRRILDADHPAHAARIGILCLSRRVADAAGGGWRAVMVAAHPDAESLMETLHSAL